MLSIEEYNILNSCACDAELFYFLFHSINYEIEPESGDKIFSPKKNGFEIARIIIKLINLGLLDCWHIDEYGKRTKLDEITEKELDVYKDYNCLTFEEHLDKYDYSPHEFKITKKGIQEINKPEYEAYEDNEKL